MPLALEATCVYQNNMRYLGTGLAGMEGQEISQRSLLGQSLIAGADSHRAILSLPGERLFPFSRVNHRKLHRQPWGVGSLDLGLCQSCLHCVLAPRME